MSQASRKSGTCTGMLKARRFHVLGREQHQHLSLRKHEYSLVGGAVRCILEPDCV